MIISKHTLSMAAALVLGVTIVVLTADSVAAESKKPKDNGVRCAIPGAALGEGNDDYEFFMPGEQVIAQDGTGNQYILKCMPDGTWKKVYAHEPVTTRPAGAGRVSGHTLERAP